MLLYVDFYKQDNQFLICLVTNLHCVLEKKVLVKTF